MRSGHRMGPTLQDAGGRTLVKQWIGVIFLILLGPHATYGQELLRVNTTSAPPLANDEQTGFHDLLTIEVFRRIGMDADIVWLPGERSLINLNNGIDDATVVRIAGLEGKYPSLRRVPEPIMHWEFVAFTRNTDFETSDWSSLIPYNVAFINGWKILEDNVTGTRSLTKVKNTEQLFDLLLSDRTDVIIYEKWEGLYVIATRGLNEVRTLQPPLAIPQMFMYVHERHEALIPKLNAALKKIKEDGTYQSIFDRTLRPLLPD